MTVHDFAWSHGRVEVLSTAAMLSRCVFDLGGVEFEPFARADWVGTGVSGHPGHLRELAGEFVCLPFGEGGEVRNVATEWAGVIGSSANNPPHGRAADAEWEIAELREGGITLRLDYPDDDSIISLERRIDGVPGAPSLNLSLTINARRELRTSVGLHPIIRLPTRPGALRLSAGFDVGLTYPASLQPEATQAVPGRRFQNLAEIPVRAGGSQDFGSLPFNNPTEEVLQLCGVREPITVEFLDEAAALEIDWDHQLLPSAQLWIADRALGTDPWNSRYRGLGIEPIAAAFDLADSISTLPNPINDMGFATSIALVPDEPLIIRYGFKAYSRKK
ncbi:hypothetical protein [Cryobacterium tagatosivorans]|uniref:Aldose 1-epimerase n=1 Tax=Cryobacterium tagatosivorans TaxID=1259199 RepID=A0A4R8UCG8_9MICO|nr:hypothetical protein [Cryobacterium tagatosivorans]TFB47810.1 hypothetical protein E3O23_14480 [Cryobacterium tagatosivorans]